MDITTVRAKFVLTEIRESSWAPGQKTTTLVFTTQYDATIEEDRRFSLATPNGRMEIQVDNPTAVAFFQVGKSYYFDAVPA